MQKILEKYYWARKTLGYLETISDNIRKNTKTQLQKNEGCSYCTVPMIEYQRLLDQTRSSNPTYFNRSERCNLSAKQSHLSGYATLQNHYHYIQRAQRNPTLLRSSPRAAVITDQIYDRAYIWSNIWKRAIRRFTLLLKLFLLLVHANWLNSLEKSVEAMFPRKTTTSFWTIFKSQSRHMIHSSFRFFSSESSWVPSAYRIQLQQQQQSQWSETWAQHQLTWVIADHIGTVAHCNDPCFNKGFC